MIAEIAIWNFFHASTRTAESVILSSSIQMRIDAGRGILVNSLKITVGGITLAVLPKRETSRAARAHQEQTERGVEAQRVLEIVGYGLPRKDKVEPRHAYFSHAFHKLKRIHRSREERHTKSCLFPIQQW